MFTIAVVYCVQELNYALHALTHLMYASLCQINQLSCIWHNFLFSDSGIVTKQ